jgi:hypothetical protein
MKQRSAPEFVNVMRLLNTQDIFTLFILCDTVVNKSA